MRRFKLLLVLAGCLDASFAAAADLGAKSLGRGGTGRAHGSDAGAVVGNLAALSLVEQYQMFAGGRLGPESSLGFAVGAVDTRTASVALGATYGRTSVDSVLSGDDLPGWRTEDDALQNPTARQYVAGGLAAPLLERRLGLAADLRYDWRDGERSGKESAFNFGVSAAARPTEMLWLSVGARNLLPNDYPETSRELDGGIRVAPGEYSGVEVDVVVPWETTLDWKALKVAGGADLVASPVADLRGGAEWSGGSWWASAGAGVHADKGALDYGVRMSLGGDPHFWHGLDFAVEF